jgi:hypothetical protein
MITPQLSLILCLYAGRKCGVDGVGWTAMAEALEAVTSLTSLNGCARYAAIRAGGQSELVLDSKWEAAVAVAQYLTRSSGTLTTLDLRYLLSACTTHSQETYSSRWYSTYPWRRRERAVISSLHHAHPAPPTFAHPSIH